MMTLSSLSTLRPFTLVVASMLITPSLASGAPTSGATSEPRQIVQRIPAENVVVRPESERYLDTLIMGLNAPDNNYFLLPDLRNHEEALGPDVEVILKNLFMLDFEFSHGRIMQALPANTELYVAIPSPDENSSVSVRARNWFKEYLTKHAGWTQERVTSRVFFFNSPTPILWARDVTKILGFDQEGRAILGTASLQSSDQIKALTALRDKFPKKFTIRQYSPNVPDTSPNVSVEGGDLEIVVAPSGKVELLVGRHRVLRYLYLSGMAPEGSTQASEYAVPEKHIELARSAYSQSFFNLPVTFVTEPLLRDPSKGSPELFHLDMIVTVVPAPDSGPPRAFVPTYLYAPIDSLQGTPIDPQIATAIQSEYDQVAIELKEKGYEVYRLPYSDHPVRSPVNIGKYLDRHTGKHTVLLSKYPYHLPREDTNTPRLDFLRIYEDLDEAGKAFKSTHSKQDAQKLAHVIEGAWARLDAVAKQRNPIFESNRALYESLGYDVKTVPDYTYGSGGIHCKLLQ